MNGNTLLFCCIHLFVSSTTFATSDAPFFSDFPNDDVLSEVVHVFREEEQKGMLREACFEHGFVLQFLDTPKLLDVVDQCVEEERPNSVLELLERCSELRPAPETLPGLHCLMRAALHEVLQSLGMEENELATHVENFPTVDELRKATQGRYDEL